MRQRGLEPPRYCYRQPLKLVRLPSPPLPHRYYFSILAASRTARNQFELQKVTSFEEPVTALAPAAAVQTVLPESKLQVPESSPVL